MYNTANLVNKAFVISAWRPPSLFNFAIRRAWAVPETVYGLCTRTKVELIEIDRGLIFVSVQL